MRRQIIKGIAGTGIFALGGALGGMVINGARVLPGNLHKENVEQIARDAYIQGSIPGAAAGGSVAAYLFRQGMKVTKENFEANRRILLSTFTQEE